VVTAATAHRLRAAFDRQLRPDPAGHHHPRPFRLPGARAAAQRRGGHPGVLISAQGRRVDQADGLDLGADGYLVKPFSFMVLVAQVKALLRRRTPSAAVRAAAAARELMVDPATKQVSWSGRPWSSAPASSPSLRAGQPAGHGAEQGELLRLAWGGEQAASRNAVEVYVGSCVVSFRRWAPEICCAPCAARLPGRGLGVRRRRSSPAGGLVEVCAFGSRSRVGGVAIFASVPWPGWLPAWWVSPSTGAVDVELARAAANAPASSPPACRKTPWCPPPTRWPASPSGS